MVDDFGFFLLLESGVLEVVEEDLVVVFLVQQESEIVGIENDEGFGVFVGSYVVFVQLGFMSGVGFEDMGIIVNGDVFQEVNGFVDGYVVIVQVDRLIQEFESICKW